MKESCLISIISIYLLIVGAIQPVNAATVLLDDFENIGADGTEVVTRDLGNLTISITTSGSNNLVAKTYYTGTKGFDGANGAINTPLNPANVSGTRFISGEQGAGGITNYQPIIFEFSQGIIGFGLTTLDLLESPNPSEFVTLEARDSQGAIIDSQTRSGDWGDSGLDLDWFVSSSNADIFEVRLLSNILSTSGSGFGIDDLVIHAVPIPAAAWLFGSGLLGLIGVARRKKA